MNALEVQVYASALYGPSKQISFTNGLDRPNGRAIVYMAWDGAYCGIIDAEELKRVVSALWELAKPLQERP